MKKKLLKSMRVLLVAVLLGVGANAWAYELPTGYEIKEFFIGTNNGDGTVAAETFSSGTFSTSIYGSGTLYHASGYSEKVYLKDFSSTYVASPSVEASAGETVPTYVGGTTDATKNVMTFRTRGKGVSYGTIDAFNGKIITRGKLVFSVDLNFGGYETNNAPQIIFIDKDGNNVLQLGYKCTSGDKEYFQYAVNGGTAYNDGTVHTSKLRSKYTGHSIRDIVIDMETGSVVYTVDCIGEDGIRYSTTSTKGVSIGTGKNIAEIRISRETSTSSQDYYTYMDNIELYTVVPTSATSHTYTINAKAGDTTIKTLKTSTCNEYADYSVYLPKVIKYNEKYYVLDGTEFPSYYANYTMGTSDEVRTVNYTLDESIVYFEEGESNTVGITAGDFSNGSCSSYRKASSYSSATISETGVYQAEICIGAGDANKSRSFAINTKSGDTYTPIYTVTGNIGATRGSHFSDNILVTAGTTLYTGYSSNSLGADYVIIRKIADVTNTSNIVGDINYTTNYGTAWNSTAVTIDVNTKGYYKIRNFNNTSSANLFENWYLWAATTEAKNQTAFGPNHANELYDGFEADPYTRTYTSKPTFTMADMNGATVELTAQLTDAGDGTYTLTVTGVTTKADGTQLSPDLVYVQSGFTVSTLNLYVSVEKSFLEVLEQKTFPVSVSATISSAGWATLYTPYALDFSGVSGLTAYTATCSESTVTLTAVENVPANTGVVLKGAANTYSIPVISSSDTDQGYLLGSATAATAYDAYDDYTLYMLNKVNGKAQFVPVTSGEIAAGKAFLKIASGNSSLARNLNVEFAEDVTGISQVEGGESKTQDGYYNLSGQRISQPTKGLYIVNGKKVVIK